MLDVKYDGTTVTTQERLVGIGFGVLLSALGVFWAVSATRIPIRSIFQPIPPSFLPMWAGIALALAGLLVVATYWRQTVTDAEGGDPFMAPGSQGRVVLFVLILIAYTAFLETIHYFVLTTGAMLAALLVARERPGLVLLVKAVVTGGILYLIFIRWFSVPLPGSRFF